MTNKYITDCSGKKILLSDKKYSSKCWVGNTFDFLENNKKYINDQILPLPTKQISILYPVYNSADKFLPCLTSLLKQAWTNPNEVEIIIFINEPYTKKLTETKLSLEAIQNNKALNEIIALTNGLTVKTIYQQINSGLSEVYRQTFTTLIARIANSIKALNLETREKQADKFDEYYNNSIFAVVDDDLIFADNTTFPQHLKTLGNKNAIILGDVRITEVNSNYPQLDIVLKNLMNLFIQIKNDLEICTLTPRAALIKDLIHLEEINLETPFADQIWFANAAKDKEKLLVKVDTSIEEENYPSNASMMKELADYLINGGDGNSITMFENLIEDYQKAERKLKYSTVEIANLDILVKNRDFFKIIEFTNLLLEKST